MVVFFRDREVQIRRHANTVQEYSSPDEKMAAAAATWCCQKDWQASKSIQVRGPEMAFLGDIFNLETTEESHTSKRGAEDLDSNVSLLRHVIVQKVMNLSMFTTYINCHCQST